MKKRVMFIFMCLCLIFSVQGKLITPWVFTTERSDTVQVTAIWVACTDADCKHIKSSPTSNIWTPNPKTLQTSNTLTEILPHCPETNFGYKYYFAAQGYLIETVPVSTYTCYYQTYTYPQSKINFVSQDNCKSDFTLQVQSCAEAGMPLSILTDTKLSASTESGFKPDPGIYFPPELNAWRDISTKVTATVKKQGTTTNVYSSEDTKKIYAGTTEDFSFLWQTSKNTLPGNYIITMKSFVTDPKCDQTNDVVTTVTQTVNIAESLDGCVAQVQNFRLDPVSPTPANQVLIKGDHLHTYQDWSWDETTTACTAGNAKLLAGAYLPVAYSLKIKQQPSNTVVKTLTGSLPTNSGTYNTYKAFQIPWTPTAAQCGSFIAELTTTSSPAASYACTAASKTTTATKAFTIGRDNDQDGYYNLCGDCDDSSTGQYTNPGSTNQYCNCDDNDGKVKGTEICYTYDNDCDGQIND